MKVKEIIMTASTLLGREDVVDYLANKKVESDDLTLRAIDLMVRCVNIVISELASTYIPMKKKQVFTKSEVPFSEFDEKLTKVLSVTDNNGNQKNYRQYPDRLIIANGGIVEYQYIPTNYALDDEVGYTKTEVSPTLIAYGSVSEFCLIERSFDESVMWRNKFISSLKNIILPKNKKIKERSWC